MFKMVIKEVGDQKVLFYYQEKEKVVEFISIEQYGDDDYSYWQNEILTSELDFNNLEQSLFDWIVNPPQICEGASSRGTLTDLAEELAPLIPSLKENVRDVEELAWIC